jgi:hypothetical protein
MSPSDSRARPDPFADGGKAEGEPEPDLDQFISGIYNYCDRWCERCSMTARCYVFWQEKRAEARHRAAGRDPHDWAVVLEDLREQFTRGNQLLGESAKKHGIDLDNLPETETPPPDPSHHPLQQRAEAYTHATHAFLTDLRQRVVEEHGTLEQRAMVMGTDRAESGYANLLDAYEVLSWFHKLIPTKIHRALSSLLEAGGEDEDEERALQMNDALGSAKVAYESVMKSLAALQRVYGWDKALEDQVLPLLADLEWMRKQIEMTFPGFQRFKRPGLDTDQNRSQNSR